MVVDRIWPSGREVGLRENHGWSIMSNKKGKRAYGYINSGFVEVLLGMHEVLSFFSVKIKARRT